MSDYDKILQSLSIVTSIKSIDDILSAFGLLNMPTAQKYGIAFGIFTFTLTVIAVLSLLTLGGTWRRIEEQSRLGASSSAPDAVTQRKRRPLLLERLLEGREWMMLMNYPKDGPRAKRANLTKMLMMVNPVGEGKGGGGLSATSSADKGGGDAQLSMGYQKNYHIAYRHCQDKPGGPILGGRPDHRCEAYARAYAGCGSHTTLRYRWSYARLYESLSAKSHECDERYAKHYKERPQDIIGRTVRLEPLDGARHLKQLWEVTSGNAHGEHKSYDPHEVWGFMELGPFANSELLGESEIFRLQSNQGCFAIMNAITDRLLGVIHLTEDDPKNLKVQLEIPIMNPYLDGSVEQMETCFLLLDRLFAFGYRRVQMCVDSLDVRGKRLPNRLGFTQEGEILKHMIVKDANRDSLIYGMLNSDWDKGARAFVFRKVHGDKMQKADAAIVAREEVDHEQGERAKLVKTALLEKKQG
jgi:RimJ/RimL family protein N-acetyltransferase